MRFWTWIWHRFEFFHVEWTSGFRTTRFALSTSPGGIVIYAALLTVLVVLL